MNKDSFASPQFPSEIEPTEPLNVMSSLQNLAIRTEQYQPFASEVAQSPSQNALGTRSGSEEKNPQLATEKLNESQEPAAVSAKRPHQAALEEILAARPDEPPYLIGPIAFTRVVQGIATQIAPGFMWESSAVQALQEAAEAHMIAFFSDVNMSAMNQNRVTITVEDIQITKKLRGL